MMTPSEVALEAARLICERGLAKGTHENDKGEICHNGAIHLAVCGDANAKGVTPEQNELIWEVMTRSEIVLKRMGSNLFPHRYNDEVHISLEDVVLLLKENAALDDDPGALERVAARKAPVHPYPGFFLGSNFSQPCFLKVGDETVLNGKSVEWIIE
jgi:hypothetical protein